MEAAERLVARADELGAPIYGRHHARDGNYALMRLGRVEEALARVDAARNMAGVDGLPPFSGPLIMRVRPVWVRITYDWKVRGDKPLLRYLSFLSFLLKGVFAANHHWAMAQGEESLRLEIARRRAPTPEALALIPPPAGPRFAALTKRGSKRGTG